MAQDIEPSLQRLFFLRNQSSLTVPARLKIPPFIDGTLALLFPHFSEDPRESVHALNRRAADVECALRNLCGNVGKSGLEADEVVSAFVEQLPTLHSSLIDDAQAILSGDPAATTLDEVIVSYPGFFAIAVYRIAHWLSSRNVPVVPRMMTEYAHQVTGIDIHPGASIGSRFVIDHGTGIVIGQTTVIHDNVKLYQGVTLGALSVDKTLSNTKRHPTIERDVVIYANATILGGETVIGAGSTIGGNVWLTASVPAGSRVYHKSDVTVRAGNSRD